MLCLRFYKDFFEVRLVALAKDIIISSETHGFPFSYKKLKL